MSVAALDLSPGFRLPRIGTNGALAVVAVAAVLVAYHHSLRALLRFLSADTPLAYLGLLPLIALGLAVVKARPRPDEGRLPDRQIDWILGLPLLAVAAYVAVLLPERLSYEFWTNRIDVIGLPFFVAGITCLLFGSRMLWRIRSAVVFLLLAWPLPYQLVLDRFLDLATRATLAGVRGGLDLGLVGGARETGDALFSLGRGPGSFVVNVAPQCAGANSVLGFLLVGGAVALAVPGRRRRKLAWLATGAALVMVLNVGRILAVFFVGARWGERAALEWLHPYAGLVLFAAAVAALVTALPRFGLELTLPRRGDRLSLAPHAGAHRRRALAASLGAALAVASILGLSNGALARFDPFLGIESAGASAPITGTKLSVPGWAARHSDSYVWARQYFGPSSSWHRYTMAPLRGSAGLVWLDVVQTDRLRAFSEYGIEACYRFHDYELLHSARVDVGTAAPAQSVRYREPDGGRTYDIVSWVRPVGDGRFERAVLLTEAAGAEPGAALVALATAVNGEIPAPPAPAA